MGQSDYNSALLSVRPRNPEQTRSACDVVAVLDYLLRSRSPAWPGSDLDRREFSDKIQIFRSWDLVQPFRRSGRDACSGSSCMVDWQRRLPQVVLRADHLLPLLCRGDAGSSLCSGDARCGDGGSRSGVKRRRAIRPLDAILADPRSSAILEIRS